MKKLLCIAMFTLVTLSNVFAQEQGSIELGANLGVNFSNVRVSNSNFTTESTTGFNFALNGEYYFSDRWGIKAKLIYDQKGWGDGFTEDQNGNSTTTDFTLTYLTIPVMANWHFGSTRKWYLNFGLFAGFLLDGEANASGMDISEALESADFGLALGIGYKFPINDNTKLFIELDGQSSFTNLFNETDNGSSAFNTRNSINFGVLFSL